MLRNGAPLSRLGAGNTTWFRIFLWDYSRQCIDDVFTLHIRRGNDRALLFSKMELHGPGRAETCRRYSVVGPAAHLVANAAGAHALPASAHFHRRPQRAYIFPPSLDTRVAAQAEGTDTALSRTGWIKCSCVMF